MHSHQGRTNRFRDLNQAGGLLLPNAWDAASARVFEQAGFPAVGTTSGGIANARGFPDGERIGRDGMLREIKVIVDAVALPVTADIEAGYGDAPAAVEDTVNAVLDLGVAGVNLEDRGYGSRNPALYEVERQIARIASARSAADRRAVSLVINARTDTFLLGVGRDGEERVALTIERGHAYLLAGADLVFVPGLIDLEMIGRVAGAIGGRLSLMAMPGAPNADALFAAGARRVSLGNAAMLACLGALREIANDILRTQSWAAIERTFFGYAEADTLFAPRNSLSD